MKNLILFFFAFLIGSSFLVHGQKIGLLMDSYVSDRWYIDQKLFTDKVRELGGEVQIEVAYGDPDEQVRLGKKLIADGAKVLVIVPVDATKAAAIVQAAKASGVPVIAYDRLIESEDLSFYISYNNSEVGRLQAQYALDKAAGGNFLLINGPVSDMNAITFRENQLNVLKPQIDAGRVKIIGDFVLDAWSEIESMMKAEEFFSSNKVKLDAIIAANDGIANGVLQALPEASIGHIVLTGQDADLVALKSIVSGKQSMTIYKPIKPLAFKAAEIAMSLARKEAIPDAVRMQIADVQVDAILLKPVVVDKSNYKETVVKDGHVHLSELTEKK